MFRLIVLLLLWSFGCWLAPVAAEPPRESAPVGESVTLETNLSAESSTLFSVPLDLGPLDVGSYLVQAGLSSKGVHAWDAQAQGYVPLKNLRPGQGFLLARGPGKVSFTGQRVTADAVELFLNKGWNLIGVPYESGVPLANLRIVLDGKSESYLASVENKRAGVINALQDGRNTAVVTAETTVLEPWRGYWLYVYQPCQLSILSPETASKGKVSKDKRSPRR